MENFDWQDIIDGETEASGEPINRMAKTVQENRNFLNKLPTDFELQKNKNVANGYAGLDKNAKLYENQIPDSIAKKTDIPEPVDISGKEDKTNKNQPNGYAGLDKYKLIDKKQIPSEYVQVYGGEFSRENNIPLVQSGNVIKDSGTSINDVATKGFVEQKVAGLVNSAPEALNTLSELAKALGNDEDFATNTMKEIAKKADSEQVAEDITTAKDEAVTEAKGYTDTAILKQESKEHTLLSNALKGTASGAVVVFNDVSPVEHEVECVVRSKNLLRYPYYETTKTVSGITFTDNGDGSITINGTATANVSFVISPSSLSNEKTITIPKGSTITLSPLTEEKMGVQLAIQGIDDNGKINIIGAAYNVATEKITNYEKHYVYLYVAKDSVFDNLTVYPKIEIGKIIEVSTDWVPYVAPESVKLLTYADDISATTEYTPNADGTVDGVKRISPTMSITTDTENTYVDVVYNKDINKVIEKLDGWKETPVLTIEITEQCTAIDVTTINGKAFEFSELAGYAQLVTNSANEGRLAILLNRTGSGTIAHGLVCLHASGATTEAATMKGVFEVKKEYGMWRTSNVGSNATTWLAMNAQRYEHWDSRDVFANVESITSFRLIPYSGNFNAGTVIKIYGKVVKV